MKTARTLAALGAVAISLAASGPLLAQAKGTPAVTGIDKIHAQKRVGGKVCFVDHEHYGEAEMPSRKGAEAAAIRQWQVFTVDEYGTAWGRYAIAEAKSMKCAAAGSRWVCKTEARPCRMGK